MFDFFLSSRFMREQSQILMAFGALTLLCVIFITLPAFAQENSDANAAALAELDEQLQEIRLLVFRDPLAGLAKAEEAEEIAFSLPDSPLQNEALVRSIRNQITALDHLGRVDEALERLARAETLPLPENSTQRAGLYFARARIADTQSEFGVALENYQKAYEVYVATDYTEGQSTALGQIANTYLNAGQYERAIAFIKRAQEVYSGQPYSNFARHLNLADAYTAIGRFEEASSEYQSAHELATSENLNDMQRLTLGNWGNLEMLQGNYAAAYGLVDRALAIESELATNEYFYDALTLRSELDRLSGRFHRAEATIGEIVGVIGMDAAEPQYHALYETAYKVYRDLGDHEKAFAHLAAFKRLSDEAKDLSADANNSILSAEFESAQRELEIERLRTDQLESDAALAAAARLQREIIIVSLAALGLSLFGFLIWRYVSMRRTHRMTQELNTELEAKNTELIFSNAELEKANQAKVEFLATTSHEVRTPLNAIISLTEIILEGREFTDADRDYLGVVNNSGKNLLHILDDILDMSKLEAGRLTINLRPLDISELVLDVAELWRNVAAEKGLDYEIDVEAGLGAYLCDERLIRQIISNLLSNAIKFTPDGKVTLKLQAAENGFTISVRDTGIGIAPDQQTAIFESFRQADNRTERSYGGTGLGLAICEKITAALGGKISVVSQPDDGAEFTVSIPAEQCGALESKNVEEKHQTAKAGPQSSGQNELSELRILLAEDNPANALVACAMLSGQVAKIEVVENGEEAVKAVQNGAFDLILMDKQMPVMDGVVATKKIRTLPAPNGNIPIIGLTAGVMPNSRIDCFAAGMDDYLTKPVPSAKLKEAIINAVKKRREVAA